MAAKTLHAVDYLAAPQKHPAQAVCVVFGDEPFLRRQALMKLRQHTDLPIEEAVQQVMRRFV